MTRIRAIAREAFRQLPDEEQQTMAVHAFCEGLKDRGVAALLATQARNSAARAVRNAAEATAVNTKKIETKRRSKSSRKALLGLSSQNAERHSDSLENPQSPLDSENCRSPVHSESEDAECMVGAPGRDS